MHFGQGNTFSEPSQKIHRASGNLSYLEFIRLVQRYWNQAHPSIPIVPQGNDNEFPTYPCIVYHLDMRRAAADEPKPKYRETQYQNDKAIIYTGQKFINLINFSAVTQSEPTVAEEVIEAFEEFMQEHGGAFQELGANDIRYSRRMPDRLESRTGVGVVMRTVQYMVTLERITSIEVDRIEEIRVDARVWIDKGMPVRSDLGTVYDPSPRFYLDNVYNTLTFSISQEDIDAADDPEEVIIRIQNSNFRVGDKVYMSPGIDATPSATPFERGMYVIAGIVNYAPFSDSMGYTIQRVRQDGATPIIEPIEITEPLEEGFAHYLPDNILVDILDFFLTTEPPV